MRTPYSCPNSWLLSIVHVNCRISSFGFRTLWAVLLLLGLFIHPVNSGPTKSRLTPADEPRIRVPSSSAPLNPSGYVPPLSSSSFSTLSTDATLSSSSSSPSPVTSSTAVYHGIGIGSRVTRGPSWIYDNQDGGDGKVGTVIELRRWKASYNTSHLGSNGMAGVRVLWDNDGTINTYRWSAKGLDEGGIQDLKVVGWKELTPSMQNIPSKQEELLSNYKNQLASVSTIELLIDLFHNLNGPQWYAKRGWEKSTNAVVFARNRESTKESNSIQYIKNSNNPCTDGWEGITCIDGVVIGIDLSNNNLQGNIPLSLYRLLDKGVISLNLAHNPGLRWEKYDSKGNPWRSKHSSSSSRSSLSYVPLEEFCSYGKHLHFIDLSATNLYGTLPECFSKLYNLETLALHSNSLEGSIPVSWSTLLGSSSTAVRSKNKRKEDHRSTTAIPTSSSPEPYLKALQLHGNPSLSLPIPETFIEREESLEAFTLPSHLMYELRILRQQYLNRK